MVSILLCADRLPGGDMLATNMQRREVLCALAALVRAKLNYRNADRVYLTHLHDDHVADVVSLMGHQWTGGRVDKIDIRGPRGTKQLVAAAIDYGRANEAIRLVDESRTVRLRDLFTAHEVKATASVTTAYADARVSVTAVENSHYPAESKRHMTHCALSYRFDTKDRRVVFSGDTAYSSNLVALAQGADMLICEAMHVEATRKGFDERVAAGAYADNPEGIWKHIVSTHTPVDVAGRMAREAGVKRLVLNHLKPGGWTPEMTDAEYAGPATSEFMGEIIVGRDQLVL
jgi:ribonuclease BN (tRNA processing enzyme)